MGKMKTFVFITGLLFIIGCSEPLNYRDNVVTGSATIEETRLELEADLSEKVFQLNENFLPLNEFMLENKGESSAISCCLMIALLS